MSVASRDTRVGDLLLLESDDRVLADCVLLRAATNDKSSLQNAIQADDSDNNSNDERIPKIAECFFQCRGLQLLELTSHRELSFDGDTYNGDEIISAVKEILLD